MRKGSRGAISASTGVLIALVVIVALFVLLFTGHLGVAVR